MTLPAYLQQSPAKKINEVALLGIGSTLPPHVSIRGNTFTLVDASGATQPAGPVLDVNIADLSDVICKQYYSDKWNQDSNDPPLCWSANGVAPSREALEPQSPTCEACQWNVRGSAVSAMSGVAIKKCRDERWLAILIPSIPQVQFQLKLTPGSFKNWGSYVKTAEGSQTQISDVLTRVGFAPGVTGVLTFQAVNYIDEATAKLRNMAYEKKSFDVLVGRNDRPIQAMLAAPAAPASPMLAQPAPAAAPFAATASPSSQTGFAQPAATGPSNMPGADVTAPHGAQTRRRRRTAAEIAADNVQQGQPAQATAPAIAPFRPQVQEQVAPATSPGFLQGAPQAPGGNGAAPAAPAAQFGIAPGVAPNPEITQALDGLFGKK